MKRRDILHYLGIMALCPLGGFIAFVIYVSAQVGGELMSAVLLSTAIWIAGYPIAMAAAGTLGIPLLIAQSRSNISAWRVLPVFVTVGAIGGVVVHGVMFGRDFSMISRDMQLTFEYLLIGVSVSLAAWLLATFGPLKLSGLRVERGLPHAT